MPEKNQHYQRRHCFANDASGRTVQQLVTAIVFHFFLLVHLV